MEPLNILVPIDFSKAAIATLKCAIPMANFFGAEVSLVHVVEFKSSACDIDNTPVRPPYEDTVEQVVRRLKCVSRRAVPPPLRGNTFVRVGEPVRQIIETAGWLGFDPIVLTTHGRTGVPHRLNPSITERVPRCAPCPVLTVRQEFPLDRCQSRASDPARWKNILVPVDFTESSRNALRYAVSLAHVTRSKLTLVHLAAIPVGSSKSECVEMRRNHDPLRCKAEARLAAWADEEIPKTLAVDTVVRVGGPAGPFVFSAAERFTADLIVRGSHRHTWSERLTGVYTAERIARTAPCPMFSIPELPPRDQI